MNLLLVVLGTAVLVVVTIDQFATIAGTGAGSGLVVRRLNDGLWRLALRVHRMWPSHRRLAVIGTGLLVLTPLVWILGLWVGWTAIFAASTDAVVDGQGREPATGFTLFLDSILRAAPPPPAIRRIFMPHGAPPRTIAALRGKGRVVVAGLAPVADDAAEARRLSCCDIFIEGRIVALDSNEGHRQE